MNSEILEEVKAFLKIGNQSVKKLQWCFNETRQSYEDKVLKMQELYEKLDWHDSMPSVENTLNEVSAYIKNEVSGILESLSHYRSSEPPQVYTSAKKALEEFKQSDRKLKNAREKLNTVKLEYLTATCKAKKANKVVKLEDDPQRVALAEKNASQMKAQAEKALEVYFAAFAEEKKLYSEHETAKKLLVESCKNTEETRIDSIKELVKKFVDSKKKLCLRSLESLNNLESKISQLDTHNNVNFFEDKLLSKIEPPEKAKWVSYEEWKKELSEEDKNSFGEKDYVVSESGYTPLENNTEMIKTVVNWMVPKRRRLSFNSSNSSQVTQESSEDEAPNQESLLSKVSSALQTKELRKIFTEALYVRKHYSLLEKEHILRLAGLVTSMLTHMISNDEHDTVVFYAVVELSHTFYCLDPHKKHLYHFISQHPIFNQKEMWLQTFELLVLNRVYDEKQNFYKNKSRLKKIGVKVNKDPYYKKFSLEKTEQNAGLMLLTQFAFYMVNLKVPLRVSYEVVSSGAQSTKLPFNKVFSLVTDLHSIHTRPVITSKTQPKSTQQRCKEKAKYGQNLALGLASEFLAKQDFLPLLLVEREWHNSLKLQLLSKCLLEEPNTTLRRCYWAEVLTYSDCVAYSEIKTKLQEDKNSIKQVEEVIAMDVLRSYSGRTDVDSELIENVLKAYAYYNAEVGYCQGMNYLAGTLNLVFKEEEQVFWAMCGLIKKFKMEELYCEELPRLKFFFYTLDRLIGNCQPCLRSTLNAEMVSSSHFCSSWLITLFGSLLNKNPELLLKLWDYFLSVSFT